MTTVQAGRQVGGENGCKLGKASAQKVYQLVWKREKKVAKIHKWKIIAFSCSL